jgi:hypothetical protein
VFAPDDSSITARIDDDIVLVTVRGEWDRKLWPAAASAVRKCLAESPAGLIVDLSGLIDPEAASAPTWMTAQGVAARMHPPVPMALVVPAHLELALKLQRLGARRFLPVFAREHQARTALAGRMPLTDQVVRDLTAVPDAIAEARRLAGDACRAWRMPSLRTATEVVTVELVANAMMHARPPVRLVVSRRGSGVHVCVHDGDDRPPRLLPVTDGAPRRGLHVVQAAALFWGSIPSSSGKVVWALIQMPLTGPR